MVYSHSNTSLGNCTMDQTVLSMGHKRGGEAEANNTTGPRKARRVAGGEPALRALLCVSVGRGAEGGNNQHILNAPIIGHR